jgi:hypothetical protein
MMRPPLRSAEDAIAVLGTLASANLAAARRRGPLSHAPFVRQPAAATGRPAANARHGTGHTLAAQAQLAKILAVDSWPTLDGLTEHCGSPAAMDGLDDARPDSGRLSVAAGERLHRMLTDPNARSSRPGAAPCHGVLLPYHAWPRLHPARCAPIARFGAKDSPNVPGSANDQIGGSRAASASRSVARCGVPDHPPGLAQPGG